MENKKRKREPENNDQKNKHNTEWSMLYSKLEWKLSYEITSPDLKRPTVNRGTMFFKTEEFLLEEVVRMIVGGMGGNISKVEQWAREIGNHEKKTPICLQGIPDDLVESIKITFNGKRIKKAHEVWMESARRILHAANEGVFNEKVYSDSYMDMDAFTFTMEGSHIVVFAWLDDDNHLHHDHTKHMEQYQKLWEKYRMNKGFTFYLIKNYSEIG